MKASKKRKFVINIERMKRWWIGQSVHNDKGGNFNVNLYIDYLNAISQQ